MLAEPQVDELATVGFAKAKSGLERAVKVRRAVISIFYKLLNARLVNIHI
jgi:hypothetical protein